MPRDMGPVKSMLVPSSATGRQTDRKTGRMAVRLTVRFQQRTLAATLAGQPLKVNRRGGRVVEWVIGRPARLGDALERESQAARRDATAVLGAGTWYRGSLDRYE